MDNEVKIKIGEIEFEAKGDEKVIERERKYFFETILPVAIEATKISLLTNQPERYITYDDQDEIQHSIENTEIQIKQALIPSDFSQITLLEFIKQYGNIPDADFVLLSAFYFEQRDGVKEFSLDMIKKFYIDARKKDYSNFTVLLNSLLDKGYIKLATNNEQKAKFYLLTRSGIDFVLNYSQKSQKKVKNKRTIAGKKKALPKIALEYESLNLDSFELATYPELSNFKDFKDKMMLILYMVVLDIKGENFTVQDILFLMNDVFSEPATRNQVNGVLNANKKWFIKNDIGKNVFTRKLSRLGMEYAKALSKKNTI